MTKYSFSQFLDDNPNLQWTAQETLADVWKPALASAIVAGGAGAALSDRVRDESETPAQRRRRILRNALLTAGLAGGATVAAPLGYRLLAEPARTGGVGWMERVTEVPGDFINTLGKQPLKVWGPLAGIGTAAFALRSPLVRSLTGGSLRGARDEARRRVVESAQHALAQAYKLPTDSQLPENAMGLLKRLASGQKVNHIAYRRFLRPLLNSHRNLATDQIEAIRDVISDHTNASTLVNPRNVNKVRRLLRTRNDLFTDSQRMALARRIDKEEWATPISDHWGMAHREAMQDMRRVYGQYNVPGDPTKGVSGGRGRGLFAGLDEHLAVADGKPQGSSILMGDMDEGLDTLIREGQLLGHSADFTSPAPHSASLSDFKDSIVRLFRYGRDAKGPASNNRVWFNSLFKPNDPTKSYLPTHPSNMGNWMEQLQLNPFVPQHSNINRPGPGTILTSYGLGSLAGAGLQNTIDI